MTHPDCMFDVDGIIIAVRGHGMSRIDMAEHIREWNECVFDDMTIVTDDDRCVYRLSDYRYLCNEFRESWMRPLRDPDDPESYLVNADWDVTYVWCGPDHPDAIPYTATGLT